MGSSGKPAHSAPQPRERSPLFVTHNQFGRRKIYAASENRAKEKGQAEHDLASLRKINRSNKVGRQIYFPL